MIGRRKSLEKACLAEMTPPFALHIKDEAAEPSAPVIFASPHSGSIYPEAFVTLSQLSREDLSRNEDIWIHKLFGSCVEQGAALLMANFPRSFLDVNRAADEILPETGAFSNRKSQTMQSQPSARARAGLGVVPTIIAEGIPIYARPPRPAEIQARLEALYGPYHNALLDLTRSVVNAHGHCLLIDCHSMPGFAPMGARRSDIILGDCHGVSCRPETIAKVEALFKQFGYSVTRNYPYAGGFVTSHYHKTFDTVETLQIEINRDLYVNPVTRQRKTQYTRLEADIKNITQEIIDGYEDRTLLAAQ